MAEGQSQEDPKLQVEAARKAFEQEFERFASFAENSANVERARLERRGSGAASTRRGPRRDTLGKKSALAAS